MFVKTHDVRRSLIQSEKRLTRGTRKDESGSMSRGGVALEETKCPYVKLTDLDLHDKTVIMRVDFNCPLDLSNNVSRFIDTKRIDDHLETTIKPLFELPKPPRNIVLLAHQGRHGKKDCITLRPHFEHCRSVLRDNDIKTFYAWEEYDDEDVLKEGEPAVASDQVLERIKRLRQRSVLLLENVRFSNEEDSVGVDGFKKNPLINMLGQVSDAVYALDSFSVAHRNQASVVGMASLGNLCAGPALVRDIEQLSIALESPEEPIVLVVGGGKVDDSLQSIGAFLRDKRAHKVLIGGLAGMAMLIADKVPLNDATIKNVRHSSGDYDAAIIRSRALLDEYRARIELPSDVAYAIGVHRHNLSLTAVGKVHEINEEFGDIGIETIGRYIGEICKARTIIMNGPVGRYESFPMALGTQQILQYSAYAAAENRALALIGGGDTSAALERIIGASNIKQCTAGKAFLEVLASGRVDSLPGIMALARV